ncbi:MAG: PEP-CTERM sorting domain-containing protein [Armatimonadetes bacterium]|nr:PEP-CTERM sorting domain-containing protein [Armatimonadota bacterium]
MSSAEFIRPSRIHSLRVLGIVGLIAASLVFAGTPARAWVYYYVPGVVGTVGLVAEQIVPAATQGLPAAYGYDYEYELLNVGTAPISGFALFTGGAAVEPLQFSQVNLPHNPAGWGLQFGPVGNGIVPFLTAEGNIYSPGPWRFNEYDNRNPLTGYTAYWTSFPTAPPAPLPVGFWTRFDLFSTNGPVSGSGIVDPFASGDIGINVAGGAPSDPTTDTFDYTAAFNQAVTPCGDPSNPCQDPTMAFSTMYPNSQPDGPTTPFGSGGFATAVPEPTPLALLGSTSLLLLGYAVLRRKKAA